MNFAQIKHFFLSWYGVVFMAVAGVVILGYVDPIRFMKNSGNQTTTIYSKPSATNFSLSVSRPMPTLTPIPVGVPVEPKIQKPTQTLFSVHVDLPAETNAFEADFLPFGRLVQCQLVNTLETISIETPIIGLVTQDVWHDGNLVIPAGTEVHGRAKADRARERIASLENWRLVFQNGDELPIHGFALDREFDTEGAGWGITDGSAGIRGQVLKSDSLAEAKLFLATALSGMAEGLVQTRTTALGNIMRGTARNAGVSGASKVLDTYAEQIQEAVKRDGIYVRVPAGKQFYLYLNQTVDKGKAMHGAQAASR